jgi:hypothetical protein
VREICFFVSTVSNHGYRMTIKSHVRHRAAFRPRTMRTPFLPGHWSHPFNFQRLLMNPATVSISILSNYFLHFATSFWTSVSSFCLRTNVSFVHPNHLFRRLPKPRSLYASTKGSECGI